MTEAADRTWGMRVLTGEDAAGAPPTDGLAAAIRGGDEDAFNLFYDRFADRLYRYLFAILPGQDALVRDVFQETMLRVVRYIKPMPNDDALWAWLTRVARTTLYDQLRKRRRRADREAQHGRAIHPEEWPRDDEAERRLREALRSALETLDPDERALVEAYYFRGESQARIGAEAGTSRKAIESRLARIRAGLRAKVQGILKREV